MDMYRILENFDAVNSKQTLTEGEVKRAMHADADKMSRAEFVDKYGAENGEFWDIVRGDDDEELDEGFLGFGMPKFRVAMNRSARQPGLLDITGSERDGKKVMAALQKANPELAAQGRHMGGSGRSGYIYYGIEFPSTALAQQAAAALGGIDEEQLDEGPYTRLNTYRINGQDMIDYLANQDGAQVEMRGDDVGILVVDTISFPRLAKMAADLAQQGKITAIGGPATKDMTGKAVRAGVKYPISGIDEERRSPEEFDADALAKQKARLAREKQRILMQRKISGQDSGKPPAPQDVSEDDVEEGNRFAYNVIKAKAAGKKQADLDGDGDMETVREVFPGTTEYELRFGKDDAASAFDKKKTSTGTVYSRKHFDEPDTDDDAPRSAGRPKGTGRKLGAKGPSVASKLLKGKGGLKEHDDEIDIADRGEYDQEGKMARQDLHTMVDAARELHAILGSDENLPEWVQSKITKALDYIDTARDYMQSVDAERRDQPMAEIAPVIGAMAGRALAGAAGAGSVGQALGGLAGRAVAGAMNSGDDEVAEASPPGEFKPGDRVLYMNKFATIIAQDGDAYGIRIDGKPGTMMVPVSQIKKPSYDEGVDEADMKESALQGYLGKKKYGADGMKALQQAGRDGASKEKMAKIRAQHDQMDEADITEKAPPGAKAERMVKHIKSGYAKDGKLTDKEKAIAYATAHKARNAGQIEEVDKKDPPFSADKQSPFKKATNPNRSASDTVKALAQKGLADMTTAELRAELKRRDKVEEESTNTKDGEKKDSKSGMSDKQAKYFGKKTEGFVDTVKSAVGIKKPLTTAEKNAEFHKANKGKNMPSSGNAADDYDYFTGRDKVLGGEKKDKEEKVDETTVSGSVATSAGGDAPKKGKGGMQFGKGVYEAHVAESFEKQLKNVLNEGMTISVSKDDMGKKNITVSATEADADALGDMLKMAGLFSSEGYSSVCQGCGGIHEAGACGADMVEEELANSPDEVYADADYMTQTLSGGLNGPKTTGQTTGAVVNRQDSRQGVMAEAGTSIPLGPDPIIELRRAAEQGWVDASRGIDNNPYFNTTRAGRAYRQGQESYEHEFGNNGQPMPTPAALARRWGGVKEVAERVKTQAESRLWNLYRKI